MPASKQVKKLEEQLLAAKDVVERIDALNDLAWELREHDSNRSHDLAELALNLSHPSESEVHCHSLGSARALIILGELANNCNKYGLALTLLLEANTLLQNLPAPELLAESFHSIGWSHYQLGNFAESADYLGKALKIFRDVGNRQKESSVLSSTGSLYNKQGNHAKALEIFDQARALLEEQDDTRSRAVKLNNLALAQMMVGAYDEALLNAQASYAIFLKLGLSSLEVNVLDTIGQIYLASGDIRNAEKTYETCLDLARAIKVEHIQLLATLNLGKVYIKQGLLETARVHFTRAITMADSLQDEKYRSQYHEMLTLIYEKEGDLQKALIHYKEYHSAMKKVQDDSARYRLENLKILHQEEKIHKEVEVLWLQNQALEQEKDERHREHDRLETMATTDPLTGIYNRRHFFTLGEYEMEKSRQMASPLSLIFLDSDHFKRVNDTYGHATGDLVLTQIAHLISVNVRKGDIVCRIGGEEFAILLPDTQLANAQAAAERIRMAIFSNPIHISQTDISITASLGVVEASVNDHDLAEVLAHADEALFRAKLNGRNRVSI